MKICIIDYGMGNIGSVWRALRALGADPVVKHFPQSLDDISRYILPGVGSFADGMQHLHTSGWYEALQKEVGQREKPLLGVCLGMQLLASEGEEGVSNGMQKGLAFIKGQVLHLHSLGCSERVPHVGWNSLIIGRESRLLKDIPSGTDYYFVHSYALSVADREAAVGSCDYGVSFVGAVEYQNVMGTQFHPEKSSRAGMKVLSNFLSRC